MSAFFGMLVIDSSQVSAMEARCNKGQLKKLLLDSYFASDGNSEETPLFKYCNEVVSADTRFIAGP